MPKLQNGKNTILKNYELVSEAYRLKFKNNKIKEGQTYAEFVKRKKWIR